VVLVVSGCPEKAPIHEIVQIDGDALRISTHSIADGGIHFFTFEHDGKNVNFLVRTDGGGVFHCHLDACYACYRYRRGFVVEGQSLVCIACRLEYAITDEVWDYIGACAPISIHSTLENDELVIRKSILERAARYF